MKRLSPKAKAVKLRMMGFSLGEISSQLSIPKSTVSHWFATMPLSQPAKKRLDLHTATSRAKGAAVRKHQSESVHHAIRQEAASELTKVTLTPTLAKAACALMYGGGSRASLGRVAFTSSDPATVTMFVKLLRKGFTIDTAKLRGLMYLYQSHSEVRQKAFWSRITGIPERQFTKTHITKQPQKRVIASYPGCVRITYYDSRVASSLAIWYNAFATITLHLKG